MRKTILAVAMLFAVNLTAQTYENEVLTTKTLTGLNVMKDVKFNLPTHQLDDIRASGINGDVDLIKFIDDITGVSILKVKVLLKNRTSFDIIDDTIGEIYIDDRNHIRVVFYFSGQNGFGNTITSKAYVSVRKNKKGELKYNVYTM